jgi:transposase InsO family protein
MCAFFGVSRAAYYAWAKRIEGPDPDAGKKELVQKGYQASHRTYGYRRVTWWIDQNCGVTINHKAVLRLMNQLGIRSVARKRKIFKKMAELETYHHYPNLLNRDFTATRPNQKWVTDVTYILTREGWAYLSIIKDLYDGFIVAHQFGRENSVALVQQTLRKAKQKEKVTDGLVLHSDHIVPMSFGKGSNTLRRRILSSLMSITLLPPCPGAAIAGTTPPWRTSLDISRKKRSASINLLPSRRLNRSLMTTFASTSTKGYN